MENKNIVKKLVLVSFLFFFVTTGAVFAQDGTVASFDTSENQEQKEEKNYIVHEAEDGSLYLVQTLSWQKLENVLSYEVVIENNINGVFSECLRQKTVENKIEVTLGPGYYHYKVLVYNLLDKIEIETDWYPFNIIQAIQPEIKNISPEIIYLEEDNDGIYRVEGNKFFNESEFVFKNIETDKIFSGTLSSLESQNSKNSEERKALVYFNVNAFDVGSYKLFVTNIGGLYSSSNEVIVKFKKLIDLDLSAGYSCPIVVRDENIKKYFGRIVFPLSTTAKITFIPFKRRFGYFGIGLTGTYFKMGGEFDTYNIDGNVITGSLDFVYQAPIVKQKLILDTRLGAGLVCLNNLKFHFSGDIESEPLNSIGVSAHTGLAMQVYLLKRLYLELSCEYTMTFGLDMAIDILQPSIFVGWQF